MKLDLRAVTKKKKSGVLSKCTFYKNAVEYECRRFDLVSVLVKVPAGVEGVPSSG